MFSKFSGCSADPGQPAGDPLHGAYADCLNASLVEEAGSMPYWLAADTFE
jgi:hypothetical protein